MTAYFSIVLPLYNKENYIADTLKSVFKQTFQGFEVIVVNDGSTDASLDVIKPFKDNRLQVFSTTNKGVAHARNFGIAKAKGSYVAFLDSDDIWLENHLSELKKLIEAFPGCGAYATNYEKHFFNTYITNPKFNGIGFPYFGIVEDYFKSSLVDNVLWTSVVAIPKPILEKGFIFDEQLRCGEDIDLWIRIANQHKVAFSSHVTAHKMIFTEDNHLSLSKNIPNLMAIFEKQNINEQQNPSLKAYMDVNRFAAAMEAKIRKDHENYRSIKKAIDYRHLNYKLRILLSLPSAVLIGLKKVKFFLLKHKLYISPFR